MNSIMLGAGVAVLAALTIGLITSRNSLFQSEKDTWLKIFIGMIFLDVFALTNLLAELGLTGSIPYIRDEIMRMLVTSICLIGGSLFILAGLATWIPMLIRSSRGLDRMRDLTSLVDSIQHICSRRLPTSQLLTETTKQVFDTIRPKELIYMRWDEQRNLLAPVHRFPDEKMLPTVILSMMEKNDWLRDVIVNKSPTRKVHDGSIDFSSDGIPFSLVKGEMVVTIPVTADGSLLGVLAMTFAHESLFEEQDIAVLQVGLSALAVAVNSVKVRDSYEESALLMDTHSRLLKIAVDIESLSDLLVTGKEQCRVFVPYDMLSISVVDGSAAAMKRHSVMASGNKVSERGLSLPVHETIVEHVVLTRAGDISNNLTGIVYRDDAWLSKCGFNSRLSVPIFIGDRVVGVASFASMALAGFSESHMSKAELLAEIFSVAISNSLIRDRLKSRDKQMQTSWRLLSRLASTGNIEKFFDEFAKQVTSSMPVTCCRLSSYNRDADRLRVVTEHSLRDNTEPEGRTDAETPIDRMPHHRSVLESGRALVVNQADKKDRMTDEEIAYSFPNRIRSAIIVPLNVGGTVRGVMSLGEARDPSRRAFDSGDLSFAQMQATQASLALAISDSNTRLNSLRSVDQNGAAVLETFSDLSRRMAGPLSSIIGAAELLERNLPDTGSQKNQCVTTIRRNTNKVVKIVDDFKQFRDAVS